MLNGYVFVSILLAISFIILGLITYIRSPERLINRVYLAFSICMAIWLVSNYMGGSVDFDKNTALFTNRLLFVFGGLALLSVFIFSRLLVGKKINQKIRIFVASSCVVILLSATSLVVKSVYISGDTYSINFGLLSNIYFPLLIFILVFSIYTLVRNRKYLHSGDRTAIDTVLISTGIGISLVLLTNVVLPSIFDNYQLTNIGSFSSSILIFGFAYAIIKHRLFDIRLIVFRSIGYIFSVGLLVVGFAVLSSIFSNNLFENQTNSFLAIALNAVLLTIAILAYPPLKKFFDKITNKYFFRDAYDPQEFLDELNKNIVSNIELGILLRHTTNIIQENLKSSFCQIFIHETDSVPMRVVGTDESNYTAGELAVIRDEVKQIGKRAIVTDDIPIDAKELKAVFTKHNIDLAIHLTTNSYGNEQTIAYIIFGAKKSGNIYSGADLKIIDIIADELVIAIQNALRFEEIQEFNVTLQKKVNDATAKLRRTNEKLKTLDETKDEFISMASHQLRTPLTSVKGYLSMVLEGDAGDVNDNQRKLLDQAFVSSQRMVYLIADLLNVSRLRTGKFVVDAQPTNLADVVEGEISQLIEQARAKDQTLVYEKPAGFPILLLDETKIRQVVMNFADNALFYTPNGGKINISLTDDKNHIYFAVKDNGIGVPKEEQKHMFTKFYRAKNARNARPDGTGLGLFMAKKVITAQGGNILFESMEGKGSTFGFSFNKKHLVADENQPEEMAETKEDK